MPTPSRARPVASSSTASRSARHRLSDALSTLTTASAHAPRRPTVSSLCRAADVSRNTLYRYYPDMAEAIRQLRRRRGARRQAALQCTIATLRAALTSARQQLAQLAALADHYYTATEELRAQLARRERDFATLRTRARPTLVSLHRPPPPARGS